MRILAVVAAVLLLWAFLWPRDHEPSYQGRTLSEWLIAYTRNPSLRDQATNAVHHIGTNALPHLVKWTSYRMPKWRKTVIRPAAWLGGRRLLRIVAGSAAARAEVAQAGFEILGPEAAPAVPELTKLAGDRDWRARGNVYSALLALRHIGNAGLPPLVSLLTNRAAPAEYRWVAASQIDAPIIGLDTNASWAVPVLIGCLDDPVVAPSAAAMLGNLRLEPALAVPALARCLQQDNPMTPDIAARALANFGTNASAAVPDLVKALGSTNNFVRVAAKDALEKIAPEVLKKTKH